MKLVLNIEKRYVYAIVGFLLVLVGIVAVNAYGTWSPPVMGHTPGEIGPGTFGAESVEPKGVNYYTFINPVQIKSSQSNVFKISDSSSNQLFAIGSTGNVDMKAASTLNAPNVVTSSIKLGSAAAITAWPTPVAPQVRIFCDNVQGSKADPPACPSGWTVAGSMGSQNNYYCWDGSAFVKKNGVPVVLCHK